MRGFSGVISKKVRLARLSGPSCVAERSEDAYRANSIVAANVIDAVAHTCGQPTMPGLTRRTARLAGAISADPTAVIAIARGHAPSDGIFRPRAVANSTKTPPGRPSVAMPTTN